MLSIIIPAFNEENRIKNTLLAIHDYVQERGMNAEIIVVDDGSTDRTKEVVSSRQEKIKNLRLVSYKKNIGKGFAVKRGVEEAKGDLILFTDADNATPIEELEKLEAALSREKADIAIGSRYLAADSIKIRQPFYRIAIGRLGNFAIRWFLIPGISDTQCGFKLFTKHAAKEIFSRLTIFRFGFDMEALVIAVYLKFRVAEVAVHWFNSSETRLRPIRDTFRTLGELWKIKWNLLRKKYG